MATGTESRFQDMVVKAESFESGGAPIVAGGFPSMGDYFYVDGTNGDDNDPGTTRATAKATVQSAVTAASSWDRIIIAPGEYDEAVTIPRAKSNIMLIGAGGRGAVFIAPSTAAAVAVTNHADDVTIVNVGMDGNTTGAGLINTGSRLRVYGSKLEGDDIACQLTLGTVAQEAAGTHGVGADVLFEDCETAWATIGVKLTCTDYGAVTQVSFRRCKHHNHSGATFDESVGSGGSAAVMFQNLEIADGVFDDIDDGTAPTAFILLNDDNANTGIVTRCSFPTAINSGDNLVSTALHWVCNYHTGGISTGQPS